MDPIAPELAGGFKDYVEVLRKYAVFTGRAGRREYWMFALVNMVIVVILGALSNQVSMSGFKVLQVVYGLAVLLPGIAVTIRRLHDTGRGGGWIFISLIPIVGSIILLVFLATKGAEAENRFGPAVPGNSLSSSDKLFVVIGIIVVIIGTSLIGVQIARSVSLVRNQVGLGAQQPSAFSVEQAAANVVQVPLGSATASVTFPSTPSVVKSQVGDIYAGASGEFSYLAMVYLPVSGELDLDKMEQALYESMLNNNRELKSSIQMTIKGYPALDFTIRESGITDMRGRAVSVNGHLLVIMVSHKTSVNGQLQYDNFFNSLVIQ